MSATAAALRPDVQPVPIESPAPRRFVAVPPLPQRRRRPRIAYAIVTLSGIGAIIVGQLFLGAALSHGAYELSALKTEKTQLGWTSQSIAEDVQKVSSPQYIAQNAESMGMIVSGAPAYLRLSDGAVLGVPGAASDEGVVPFGSAGLVGNSLLEGAALAGESADPLKGADGASDGAIGGANVSLKDGLPAPTTH